MVTVLLRCHCFAALPLLYANHGRTY